MRPGVVSTVGAAAVVLALASHPAAAADAVLCGGLEPTIVGTSGRDVIQGTEGPDVIAGAGGADTIEGGAGDDVICGGDPALRVASVLHGGDGNDTLYVGGKARVDGGPGDDTITVAPLAHGVELRFAGATTGVTVDLTEGTAHGLGDDVLTGVFAMVFGTDFDDVLIGSDKRDHLNAGFGEDTVVGNGGPDYLVGGYNDDTVRGGAGRDELDELDFGADRLFGGAGDDYLRAFGVDDGDYGDGGPGTDYCNWSLETKVSCETDSPRGR